MIPALNSGFGAWCGGVRGQYPAVLRTMIKETLPILPKSRKPRLIGYMRVSRSRQNTARQKDAMAAAKISDVFFDKISGTKWKRAGLEAALALNRAGDKLAVEAIDRLGRTALEILLTIDELKARGASLISSMSIAIPPPATAAPRFYFSLFLPSWNMRRSRGGHRTG